MNRKQLLFAAALFLIFALKYVYAQDDTGISLEDENVYDPANTVIGVMIFAPIVGFVIGIFRILTRELVRPALQPLRLR